MNQYCSFCKSKMNKNGSTKCGSRRWRCRGCGYTQTEGGGIQGSLPKYGGKVQSGYERLKRYRAKKRDRGLISKAIELSMSPELLEWLNAQPGTHSDLIVPLLEKARSSKLPE